MRKPCGTLMASLIALVASAAAAAAADTEMIPDSYAVPATQVAIGDGRSINLRCSGQGSRVVLFEAGTNADSATWYRVLPLLREHARVCAYDRAGYGFSDEGPLPRDLDADIADLHALIRAAEFPLPMILVGHSLGANIVRGYAQRFSADVAGMVLVDPSEQGADSAMPEQWRQDDAVLRENRDAFLVACAKAAEADDFLTSAAPGCLRPPPAWMGERVAAATMTNKAKPGYWRTLQSELTENHRVFSTPVPDDEHYGEIPLLLLSAGNLDLAAPEDVRAVLMQAREQTHQRILAASTHNRLRAVPDATHDIQLDRPDAVASAVEEMLDLTTPVRSGDP